MRKVGFKFRIGSGSGCRGTLWGLNNFLTAGTKVGNSKQQAQVEVTNHHQWPVIVSLAAGPTTSTSVQQTSVSTERNVNGKIMEQA